MTKFRIAYRYPLQGQAVSNPSKIDIREEGNIVIDGVSYDFKEAPYKGLIRINPTNHLAIIVNKKGDYIVTYMPEIAADQDLPATTETDYTTYPCYPLWPDGETQAIQTINSSHSSSLASATTTEFKNLCFGMIRDSAAAFEDQFKEVWPDSTRKDNTRAWMRSLIGSAYRATESITDGTSTSTTRGPHLAKIRKVKAEADIGILTWYAVHNTTAWAVLPTTRTSYQTAADGGLGGSLWGAGDQSTWDDWLSDGYTAGRTWAPA